MAHLRNLRTAVAETNGIDFVSYEISPVSRNVSKLLVMSKNKVTKSLSLFRVLILLSNI